MRSDLSIPPCYDLLIDVRPRHPLPRMELLFGALTARLSVNSASAATMRLAVVMEVACFQKEDCSRPTTSVRGRRGQDGVRGWLWLNVGSSQGWLAAGFEDSFEERM